MLQSLKWNDNIMPHMFSAWKWLFENSFEEIYCVYGWQNTETCTMAWQHIYPRHPGYYTNKNFWTPFTVYGVWNPAINACISVCISHVAVGWHVCMYYGCGQLGISYKRYEYASYIHIFLNYFIVSEFLWSYYLSLVDSCGSCSHWYGWFHWQYNNIVLVVSGS